MRLAVCLLLLLASGSAAQSSGWGNPPPASISGAGYSLPRSVIQAAPGRVQMPFEAIAHCVRCAIASIPGLLQVSQSGGATASVQVGLIPDVMHVTGMCDTTANPLSSPGTCARLVTHADGTIVDGFHPAAPGEELVMYLLGMGRTDPPLQTGQATPNPPPAFAANAFGLNLNFRLNAAPSLPVATLNFPPPATVPHPVYAGAVPGFAALYQVNFVLPAAGLDLSLRCAGTNNTNLPVTVYSVNLYDGAGICVLGPAKD